MKKHAWGSCVLRKMYYYNLSRRKFAHDASPGGNVESAMESHLFSHFSQQAALLISHCSRRCSISPDPSRMVEPQPCVFDSHPYCRIMPISTST